MGAGGVTRWRRFSTGMSFSGAELRFEAAFLSVVSAEPASAEVLRVRNPLSGACGFLAGLRIGTCADYA